MNNRIKEGLKFALFIAPFNIGLLLFGAVFSLDTMREYSLTINIITFGAIFLIISVMAFFMAAVVEYDNNRKFYM